MIRVKIKYNGSWHDRRYNTQAELEAVLAKHGITEFEIISNDPREHYCHCGAWGGFRNTKKSQEWFCGEHFKQQEN